MLLSVILLLVPCLSMAGLSNDRVEFWSQEDAGLVSESGDRAGSALAIGDFNSDGLGDLVIGIPSEDVGTIVDTGIVVISYGAWGGWDARPSHWWWQGSAGIPGAEEADDGFGTSLAVGDFDCDGVDDLAVGAPNAGFGAVNDGGVQIMFGQRQGEIFGDGFEVGDTSAWPSTAP